MVMAGLTTLVTVAWTTYSRAVRTSTFSCWIQKSTQTPGARRRRLRRWVRWRSLRPVESQRKKDLGMTAIRYGDVYIAQVAMGANDTHTIKAFLEAEAHPGPSLIIAYSQCIAHGIDMAKGMHQQKLAVDSGHWPLYRYNPRLVEENKNPFQLDSSDPKIPLQDYIYTEGRYRMLQQSDPAVAKFLLGQAQKAVCAPLATVNKQLSRTEICVICR